MSTGRSKDHSLPYPFPQGKSWVEKYGGPDPKCNGIRCLKFIFDLLFLPLFFCPGLSTILAYICLCNCNQKKFVHDIEWSYFTSASKSTIYMRLMSFGKYGDPRASRMEYFIGELTRHCCLFSAEAYIDKQIGSVFGRNSKVESKCCSYLVWSNCRKAKTIQAYTAMKNFEKLHGMRNRHSSKVVFPDNSKSKDKFLSQAVENRIPGFALSEEGKRLEYVWKLNQNGLISNKIYAGFAELFYYTDVQTETPKVSSLTKKVSGSILMASGAYFMIYGESDNDYWVGPVVLNDKVLGIILFYIGLVLLIIELAWLRCIRSVSRDFIRQTKSDFESEIQDLPDTLRAQLQKLVDKQCDDDDDDMV
jgi:hypothetical protein